MIVILNASVSLQIILFLQRGGKKKKVLFYFGMK